MDKDKRANASLFGIDFQVNAAIVLMLENIKDLQSLKLEGVEDIEITLFDNTVILAQAKAVEKSTSDFKNVRAKLKKSLETLSEGAQKVKAVQLIHITNSPNPLNETESISMFYGHSHRDFNTLLDSSKKIITNYLADIENPLDTSLFKIQVLPFETDDDKERYKIVLEVVNAFSADLELIEGIGKKILSIWQQNIFQNGTRKDVNIILKKKDIIWPIIVIETDINRGNNEEFFLRFDESLYDEIVHYYRKTIDNCNEKYEFFIKVLSDYSKFDYSGSQIKKATEFALTQWKNYLSEFDMMINADEETKEALIQVILYTIVKKRKKIKNIKDKVNL